MREPGTSSSIEAGARISIEEGMVIWHYSDLAYNIISPPMHYLWVLVVGMTDTGGSIFRFTYLLYMQLCQQSRGI